MNVLIIGGGTTGSFLARELYQEGQAVTVIEKRAERAASLKDELPAITVVAGDGDDPSALEVAGVRTADVVVAATGEDEDNLVACLLARQEYQVPRTLARVNNPKNEWLFSTGMGVDVWVSQPHIMASLMREEMAGVEMTSLLRLAEGEVVLVEDILQPGYGAVGRSLGELLLPANATVVAVVRGRDVLVPRADLVFQPGDRVIALAQAAQRQRLAAALE